MVVMDREGISGHGSVGVRIFCSSEQRRQTVGWDRIVMSSHEVGPYLLGSPSSGLIFTRLRCDVRVPERASCATPALPSLVLLIIVALGLEAAGEICELCRMTEGAGLNFTVIILPDLKRSLLPSVGRVERSTIRERFLQFLVCV
jgi:hypothetical protein